MDELLVEKEEIQGRIAGYQAQLAIPEHRNDKHLRLQLDIARLELEINGYAIKFNKALADGNNEDKELFADLIKSARNNLDKLLAQQQEQQQQEDRTRQHSRQQGD
jgi:DNA-binding protein YbaB